MIGWREEKNRCFFQISGTLKHRKILKHVENVVSIKINDENELFFFFFFWREKLCLGNCARFEEKNLREKRNK